MKEIEIMRNQNPIPSNTFHGNPTLAVQQGEPSIFESLNENFKNSIFSEIMEIKKESDEIKNEIQELRKEIMRKNSKEGNLVNFTIELDDDIIDILKTHAAKKNLTVEEIVESILREFIEDCQDYEAAALAWSEFEKSGKKSYSLQDL